MSTRLLITACALFAACLATYAQNRIASGSTYHTIEPRNSMPYSLWTKCVLWLTCDQNPADNPTWTVQSFGSTALHYDHIQTNASARPVVTSGVLSYDQVDDGTTTLYTGSFGVTTAFSVMMWVKVNTLTNNPIFVIKDPGSGSLARFFYLMSVSSNLYFAVLNANNSSPSLIVSGSRQLAPNVWHHIAATYSQTDSAHIYINGGLDGSSTSKPVLTADNGYPLGIHSFLPSRSTLLCDDVIFCNAKLSTAEVTNRYDATKSPTPARP
jgi:hypothetical protein